MRTVRGSPARTVILSCGLRVFDQLSAEGVTFDNAYCNSPLCGPSRASFLTGRLPHSSHMYTNSQPFHSDLPTWAHYLSIAGYQTVLIGKQHFTGPDDKHGFESRIGEEVHTQRIRPYSMTVRDVREGVSDRFFKVGVERTAYMRTTTRSRRMRSPF